MQLHVPVQACMYVLVRDNNNIVTSVILLYCQICGFSYSGPNALSQVSCSGFEESILDCKLEESTAERCTEVVALECSKLSLGYCTC